MKKKILSIIFIISANLLSGQKHYPKDYFRSPVDLKIALSGTFGELRSDHFHSGIDIKTGGKTGKNVYAIADGFISRIKVSGNGFGKTLYIKHPNGYTSVYAHLKGFSQEVSKYIKEQQYKKKSFEINIFPKSDQFVIKKGDIIALSGNSGGSDGPHLHFEIRDTKSEHPLNPLLFV